MFFVLHIFVGSRLPTDTFLKVFKTLWSEPAGGSVTRHSSKALSRVTYGEFAFSKIRRFVVVRESKHHSICLLVTTSPPTVKLLPIAHNPQPLMNKDRSKHTKGRELQSVEYLLRTMQ